MVIDHSRRKQRGIKKCRIMSGVSPVSQRIRRQIRMTYNERTDLLLFPESQETHTRDLHHLESNTRDVTLRLTTATKTGDEDFVVFVHKVKTTVVLTNSLQI
jgi:hypothetical protein